MARNFDVVIAGAGPGGSVAALALAQAGYRVALLDRGTFPRPKICGNCINPRAWKVWERLGLTDSIRALPHAQMEGFSLYCKGRLIHRDTIRPPAEGPRAVARDVLDDWLRQQAEEAGVEFHGETAVTGVDASGTVHTTKGDFNGKLILGADGRNSVVARNANLMPPPRRCHRVAWQTTIPVPAELDHHVQMHLFADGYFGMCRYNPERAVISMVLDARRSQNPLAAVRRVLPDLPEQEWLRMNPITRAPAQLGRDRVWLTGDAARVVEPFTGEGIAFALETGWMAAQHAHSALESGDWAGALRAYGREHGALYRRRGWVNTLVRMGLTDPGRAVLALEHLKMPKFLFTQLSQWIHAR